MKLKGVKTRAPWLTEEILAKKKPLWYRNRATGWKIRALLNEYIKIRKNIKKESKKATISFEQRLANDKMIPKLLYAYANSRQKVKDQISALKNNQNTVTNNKQEIAMIFNKQFCTNN